MLYPLLILIFIRPFISSLAFPYLDLTHSILLLSVIIIWLAIKGIGFAKINPVRELRSLTACTDGGIKAPLAWKSVVFSNGINQIKFPLLLFIFALLVSTVFSLNKIISIKELYKYITGILLFLVASSLNQGDRKRVVSCMMSASLLISIIAIYQYFFGFQHLLTYFAKEALSNTFASDYIIRKRVFFPFITPNALGGYLAMMIALALTQKHKLLNFVPLFFAFLLTRSLGAFLSIFLTACVYLYFKGRAKKREFFILFAIFAAIIFIFITRTLAQKQHHQPLFSTIMRLSYWIDTLSIIRAHFLTGVGLGNFNLAASRYAHNSYLQIWAELGILGLISFLWLIFKQLKSAVRAIKYSQDPQTVAITTAIIVFLVHNFVDFTFFLPEISFIWWVIFGLI